MRINKLALYLDNQSLFRCLIRRKQEKSGVIHSLLFTLNNIFVHAKCRDNKFALL